MKNPLLMSLICALMWGVWPILTNISKASSSYISIMLGASTMFFVTVYFLFQSQLSTSIGEAYIGGTKTFWLPVLAGLMNAVGIIVYGVMLSSHSGFDATKYIAITTAILPAIATISGVLFLDYKIDANKIIGLALACVGIYFLNKK